MTHDFINSCLNHMASNNLLLEGQLCVDGKIHRYSSSGRGHDKDEWYIACEGVTYRGNPFLVCTYGSWSEGVKYTYKSFDESKVIDEHERLHLRKILKERREASEALLKEQYQQVAHEAQSIWLRASEEPPSFGHEVYTLRKQVVPFKDIRWTDYRSIYPAMVIPIFDIYNDLRSLQFIYWDEQTGAIHKRFLTGGQKRGNFYMLGKPQEGMPLVVAEGYATGASIYMSMAHQWPTVVAFDAGNISPVIENLKMKYPNSEIIIAADNDTTGRNKAYDAQIMFGCRVALPEFSDANTELTDFNDLMVWEGKEEVKKQMVASLSRKGFIRKK